MNNSITYVAMDTHKKEHKIAAAFPGDRNTVEFVIKNDSVPITQL